MINFCNTLSPSDKVHAIPADFGKIIRPIPVIDKVLEVDVAAIIMILSTDSRIVFRVLSILYFSFDFWFLPLKYLINSFILLI